jgi:hypothetical protein
MIRLISQAFLKPFRRIPERFGAQKVVLSTRQGVLHIYDLYAQPLWALVRFSP